MEHNTSKNMSKPRMASIIDIAIISYTLSIIFLFLSIEPTFSAEIDNLTYGSAIKLENRAKPTHRLHSHDIKYGSGSGQQSVTGAENKETSSYWTILCAVGETCHRGKQVACGSNVRLQHGETRKYLHSHLFKSPLSSQQEISAFGSDDNSDTGDNWTIKCKGSGNWERSAWVSFVHVDTGVILSLSGNTYGRPIFGQLEVVGATKEDSTSFWRAAEGVYVQPTSTPNPMHDEL